MERKGGQWDSGEKAGGRLVLSYCQALSLKAVQNYTYLNIPPSISLTSLSSNYFRVYCIGKGGQWPAQGVDVDDD
ncbi:hypothetical protein Ddc_04450 [Ditylenchus destructor]|nr:hypothetical protein Ddc_04450 [Ditylenchus destructor]